MAWFQTLLTRWRIGRHLDRLQRQRDRKMRRALQKHGLSAVAVESLMDAHTVRLRRLETELAEMATEDILRQLRPMEEDTHGDTADPERPVARD